VNAARSLRSGRRVGVQIRHPTTDFIYFPKSDVLGSGSARLWGPIGVQFRSREDSPESSFADERTEIAKVCCLQPLVRFSRSTQRDHSGVI
jgi:hypothetical protein